MPVDEELRTVLLTDTAITAIVGTTGIYVDHAGQEDLSAYIVIGQQGHDPLGNLTETTGVGITQLDVDCLSKSRTQVRTLAKAVIAKFKDFAGTSGGVTFSAVNWTDEGSDMKQAADGSTEHHFVLTESFNVFWSE